MISEDVQRRVDAYRGNPGALAKRYQMTQELLDLLALQKLKSEKEAAAREMALAMQQGEPPTVAQQREQEVAQMSKQELAQQLGGLAQLAQQRQQPQQSPMMSGVASAPGAENVMPEQAMAAGGIVAFSNGDSVPKPIDPEDIARRMQERQGYMDIKNEFLGPMPSQRNAPAFQRYREREAELNQAIQTARQLLTAGTVSPQRIAAGAQAPMTSIETPAPTPQRDFVGMPEEEGQQMIGRGPVPVVAPSVAEPRKDGIATLLDAAQKPTARPGEVQLPSVARTPEQIAALLTAGREPQGTQSQQEMFKNLRDYQRQAAEAQFPQMSPEAKAEREAAIRRQEERLAQEFDPERRRLDFLRDFLLGGAGRTGIGSVFAGAGASGARAMSAAEAAQREREDRIEAMREALRGKTEEEARAAFMAKQKGLETALGAEKALLDLSVKMSEGDKDRGAKLAIVAQELATKENVTQAELRTRVQLEAQKLGVTLDIADADRLVKMAQVLATREEAAGRQALAGATQEATAAERAAARRDLNVRNKIDDLARIDREFSEMRTKNPMLDALLSKHERGEPLPEKQAAQVTAYLQAKQNRINKVNEAYAGIGVGGGATNLQAQAREELARRTGQQ